MIPQIWRRRHSWYKLQGSQCDKCNSKFFPPRPLCTQCRSRDLSNYQFKGIGKVLTYTVVRTKDLDESEKRFVTSPYILAIIELEEGPSITSQIVDLSPEEVQIGSSVEMVFRKLSELGDGGIIRYGYKFKLA